jgi:hypothetical protein
MDLSKLPKLSQTNKADSPGLTDEPPADTGVDSPAVNALPEIAPTRQPFSAPLAAASMADIWISFAVGGILLLMAPRLLQYVFARSTFGWTFTDEQGNPLPYIKSLFFWGDLALTSFAFVLIAEGIVLLLGRWLVLLMTLFALTSAVTALNAIYVVVMLQRGYGVQLFSVLAAGFGVYIAILQWGWIQSLRALRSIR